MRVQPHFQDTGGFFIAVLHKKDWLPWQSKTKTRRAQTSDQPDSSSRQARAGSPFDQGVCEEEASLRTLCSDQTPEDAGMEVEEGCDGHTPSTAEAGRGEDFSVKMDGNPEGMPGLEEGGDGGAEKAEEEAGKAREDREASDLASTEVGDLKEASQEVAAERPSAAILGK